MNDSTASNAATPDSISLQDGASVAKWVRKLDVTEQQIHDAVGAVGNKASDVEMHLKGTRSTTNDDRIEQAGAGTD
ncbi:DUF3606 domain-containing protein [Acidovorax sp. Leaf160]|uniref:DUF3606 domain-containing protein n=1 Tax=Acidovorax sp. Leaf160 TaxID=1736280 RepID=UPI0006F45AE9|nr:DUF3606 domain-containing protein [Acidovorax sp. Leaf160]KQR50420.1 hypothetical protein ASF94_07435 [Acidovorax sp. Leaf160]